LITLSIAIDGADPCFQRQTFALACRQRSVDASAPSRETQERSSGMKQDRKKKARRAASAKQPLGGGRAMADRPRSIRRFKCASTPLEVSRRWRHLHPNRHG
jgi:hypothetical protein